MTDTPKVPSAMELVVTIVSTCREADRLDRTKCVDLYRDRVLASIAAIIEADRERIRAETLAPFYDLVEWDSEENLEGDYAERWIKLGNKLRWMLPPEEAPDA